MAAMRAVSASMTSERMNDSYLFAHASNSQDVDLEEVLGDAVSKTRQQMGDDEALLTQYAQQFEVVRLVVVERAKGQLDLDRYYGRQGRPGPTKDSHLGALHVHFEPYLAVTEGCKLVVHSG